MARYLSWLLIAMVAISAIGCATSSERVTEGDRELSFQNQGAAEEIQSKATEAKAAAALDPERVTKALEEIISTADDIKLNSAQQIKNWGGLDAIKIRAAYTKAASDQSRRAAQEEHDKMTKAALIWGGIVSVATAAFGLFMNSTGVGAIPFIGKTLAKISSGATQQNLGQVLQLAIDSARDEYDQLAAGIRAKLKGTALEALGGSIPDGDVLKEAVETELGRRGLLAKNTAMYHANPHIPDDPAVVLVKAESDPTLNN